MARNIFGLAVLLLLSPASALEPTSLGCYKSPGQLLSLGDTYQTIDDCWHACTSKGYPVIALHNGAECFCGNQVPPANALVGSSQCDLSCEKSSDQNCGGRNTWSVLGDLDDPSNSIATEIITASDSDTEPTASFSVNPTSVETGIQIATHEPQNPESSTTIPNSILTAPTSGPGSDQEVPDIESAGTSTIGAAASQSIVPSGSSNPAEATPTTDAAAASRPFLAAPMLGTVFVSLVVPWFY